MTEGLEGFQVSLGVLPYDVTGVYVISCRSTGRVYVGSSGDVKNRLFGHRSRLRSGTHDNVLLQREFSAHGEAAFDFALLVACGDIEAAKSEESKWISSFSKRGLSLNQFIPKHQAVSGALPIDPAEARASCAGLLNFRDEASFKSLVEHFLIAERMTATAFGRAAVSDPNFVFDLRTARSCSLRTAFQVRDFIAAVLQERAAA